MKKIIILILCIVLIILSIFGVKYINYKAEQSSIQEANLEYETYLNKQITGREVTTAVNRAVNQNEKNAVSKDEQGFYIQNDTNSIEIEIKIMDNETTYKMETIYNGGMENFIQYYNEIYFECTRIDYNSLGKVRYVLFEQRTT